MANKKRNIIIITIVSILLLIGITYAWFSAVVSGNDTAKDTVVETATLSIKYTNSEELKGVNVVPGWSASKTFTVENTGTATATYSIVWANLLNEFVNKEDLVYTLTSNNSGGILEETIMPDSGNDTNIISGITIAPGVTQTYTLTINYKNQNRDQSSDAGKKLIGKIEVKEGAAAASNKYKIQLNVNKGSISENEKLVDENGTVEFDITNVGYGNPSVTCSNNQTGTIENNKLVINNVTSATECNIVYNTVTEYSLTYDLDGGVLENPTNNYTIESEDITLPNPTKTGYTFEGWTTEDNNTPEKNITIPKGSHEDKTYTANYKPIKYEVTYNANGGEGSIESSEFTYDKKASLPESTLTKDGYAFVGWSTNPNATEADYEDGEEVKNLTTTTEVTLYAVWKKQHTLTLDKNGAESISKTTLDCVVNNTDSCTITLPNITPKDGFEVVGWSTNENATTAEATAGDTVTINNNTTYYAITKSSVALSATFKANGATIDNGTTDITKSCYRYNGASACDITAPTITKSDWTIIGFGTESSSTSATNQSGSTISLSSNVTRYAVTSKEVNITYNANTGSGAPSANNGTIYNTATSRSVTISTTVPTKEGYTFLGWSTNSSAATATYTKGNSYDFSEITPLYAVWQIKKYTVNVTVLNGTITGNTSKSNVNHGTSPTFTVNPSTGYGDPEIDCTKNQTADLVGSTLTVNQISDDTTCTVTYKEITNERCFDFVNGSIRDYYDYEGGGSSGTACPRDVKIPSKIGGVTVHNIAYRAFYLNKLTSVTIPSSVTSIGDSAFMYNQLTSVTIPDSVTTIGDSAFYSNKLTSATISDNVTTIGDSAFYQNQLTSLTIPSSVTTIGQMAFNLNQLPDNQAFIYQRKSDGSEDKTTLISYGGTKRDAVIVPSTVSTIGNGTFYNNQLESVTIPNSVTSIGDAAFRANQLTSVTIPNNVTTIGERAFQSNKLTSVTIPNSVQTIRSYAFEDNRLTSVTIGTGVTEIGSGAFYIYSNSNLLILSNTDLDKIINKTGRAFDWGLIVNVSSGYNFITGTLKATTGNTVIVTSS